MLALPHTFCRYPEDPYLKYRPPFARSLPIQILLTGVVLTLVAVLFIHLIFTAQYHWPLAPVNYVLQISGVSTLLISLVATLHVVLSATQRESVKWPYMLSYIAVNVPPLEDTTSYDSVHDHWSVAEKATWLVMNASTSGLIQVGWLVGYPFSTNHGCRSHISSSSLCCILLEWRAGSYSRS